ncbi:MAG: sodium/solute symporter [Bacteroidales bacterium]|nr:sodium/solute symporter [Bacteroidales bacterium]
MTALDYLVIAAYALLMLGIGIYYSRTIKTADDYLLGGRSMSPFMIGLSLFATMNSTLSYLSLPGEMAKNGPVVFAELLSLPFVFVIVGWVLIPRIMAQRVTSGYELLETRLGLTGRLLGASMFVLLRVFWMASILYATVSVVLVPLFDIPPGWTPAITVAMAIITLIYTAEGGLKAVVVTDAIQAGLMFFGATATIIVITIALGGVEAWWPSSWPAHWPELRVLPDFDTSTQADRPSRTLIGAFCAMLVWMTCTSGSDQMSIQRYLATRDAAAARRSFGIQVISTVVNVGLLGISGLAVLGYFLARPEDLKGGWSIVSHADKLLPHFIVIGLPSGLTGLVIAAILAAAMSSLSSGLNSISTVVVRDFLGRITGRTMTSQDEVSLARYVSVGSAVIAVGLSFIVGSLATNLLELCFKVVNLLTAPIFVLFYLALFVPRSSPGVAVLATIASVSMGVLMAFGWEARWFLWSPPAALVAGVTVGTLMSWVIPSARPSATPSPQP